MKRLLLKVMVCFLLPFLLTACGGGTFHLPTQFASSTKVFNDVHQGVLPEGASSDSILRRVYNAPYEDVFRMAEVSATQAQFLIDKTDKAKGMIFASKSNPVGQRISNFVPGTWRTGGWVISEKRFYLILVEELAAEQAAVTIINKVQFECRGGEEFEKNYDECREITQPHWPTVQQRNIQAMETFHGFIKNNLISAGLI